MATASDTKTEGSVSMFKEYLIESAIPISYFKGM
jgi:hypothetical protein